MEFGAVRSRAPHDSASPSPPSVVRKFPAMVNALRRPGREVACPVTAEGEVGVVVMVSVPTMQELDLNFFDPAWKPCAMGMGKLAWYDPGRADVERVDTARANCSI